MTPWTFQQLAGFVGIVNILFLTLITGVVLRIQLAISQLETKIERNRREDEDKLRTYVDERLRNLAQRTPRWTESSAKTP